MLQSGPTGDYKLLVTAKLLCVLTLFIMHVYCFVVTMVT